jgi:hypothetical protein
MKLHEGVNKVRFDKSQNKMILEPPTPECDKLSAVKDKSQSIGEFLDWLKARGVYLANRHEHTDDCKHNGFYMCDFVNGELQPYFYNIEALLAEYFEIDLNKIEDEKLAILESYRKA